MVLISNINRHISHPLGVCRSATLNKCSCYLPQQKNVVDILAAIFCSKLAC